jgi:hypothetical protein
VVAGIADIRRWWRDGFGVVVIALRLSFCTLLLCCFRDNEIEACAERSLSLLSQKRLYFSDPTATTLLSSPRSGTSKKKGVNRDPCELESPLLWPHLLQLHRSKKKVGAR